MFTLAFSAYFGADRPFYQLAPNLVMAMPTLGFLRRYGTVAATPENAHRALKPPCGPGVPRRISWRLAMASLARPIATRRPQSSRGGCREGSSPLGR